MLALNPESVQFQGVRLGGVSSVQIDEKADKPIVEHDELGPFASYVDTPRRVVTVRAVQRVPSGSLVGPRVGQTGTLNVLTSPGGVGSGAVGRVRVTLPCVVVSVSHRVGAASRSTGSAEAERIIDFIAQSSAGDVSPITIVTL